MNIDFLESNKNNFTVANRQVKDIKFIVLHYTANFGDTAKNNAMYFSRTSASSSAHYFVDNNSVWQSVRDKNIAWHCGLGSDKLNKANNGARYYDVCTNSNSIGIEMCNQSSEKYGVTQQTLNLTAKLVSMLMLKYKIPLENVITHFDVTGKQCPMYWAGNNYEKFRRWKSMELTKEFGKTCLEAIKLYTKDLPCDNWAEKELNASKAIGITDGTRPLDLATREEVALMVYRAKIRSV